MEIRVGSIVRLKSGSPDMVVEELIYQGNEPINAVVCFFQHDGGIFKASARISSLLLVSDEKQNLTGAARTTIELCVGYRPIPDDGRLCDGKECFHCMLQSLVRGSL